jgi:hypothetical protein
VQHGDIQNALLLVSGQLVPDGEILRKIHVFSPLSPYNHTGTRNIHIFLQCCRPPFLYLLSFRHIFRKYSPFSTPLINYLAGILSITSPHIFHLSFISNIPSIHL